MVHTEGQASSSKGASIVNAETAMVMRATMASLLVAVAVGVASLLQTPKYEASAQLWVDWQQGDQQNNLAGNLAGGPRIRIDIPEDRVRLQELTLMLTYAIDSRPVAEEAIR